MHNKKVVWTSYLSRTLITSKEIKMKKKITNVSLAILGFITIFFAFSIYHSNDIKIYSSTWTMAVWIMSIGITQLIIMHSLFSAAFDDIQNGKNLSIEIKKIEKRNIYTSINNLGYFLLILTLFNCSKIKDGTFTVAEYKSMVNFSFCIMLLGILGIIKKRIFSIIFYFVESKKCIDK